MKIESTPLTINCFQTIASFYIYLLFSFFFAVLNIEKENYIIHCEKNIFANIFLFSFSSFIHSLHTHRVISGPVHTLEQYCLILFICVSSTMYQHNIHASTTLFLKRRKKNYFRISRETRGKKHMSRGKKWVSNHERRYIFVKGVSTFIKNQWQIWSFRRRTKEIKDEALVIDIYLSTTRHFGFFFRRTKYFSTRFPRTFLSLRVAPVKVFLMIEFSGRV